MGQQPRRWGVGCILVGGVGAGIDPVRGDHLESRPTRRATAEMSKNKFGKALQTPMPNPTPDPRPQALADLEARRGAARAQRLLLLNSIATARKSHVVAYVTCGRGSLGTSIGSDVIRVFREILGAVGNQARLDLFLITRGGHTLTPLRLVSLLREFAKEVHVVVPYMAHSAGTLIALGADSIVMGTMGELGPVDPSVANQFNPVVETADAQGGKLPTPRPRIPISVEDVTSYLSLASEKAKLDPAGMTAAFSALTSAVSPLALGNILRHHTLIRHLVRRLLMMHMDKEADKAAIDSLVETLTEKLYAHDYLITRDEAASLGLNIQRPDPEVETWMWDLFKLYEGYLSIGSEINFPALLGADRQKYLCIDGAVVEDRQTGHAFSYKGLVERKGADEFGFNAEFAGWEAL